VNYQPGHVTVSSNALQTLEATTAVRMVVQNGSGLDGTARGRTANIDTLLDRANSFLGRAKSLVPVDIAGATNFNANIGGTVQQPQVDVKIDSPSMQISKLKNARLDADIRYLPGRVDVQSAIVRWAQQTLALQGTVAMTGASPKLDLTARADGAAVAALITGVGQLNLNLPLKGSGLALQAHIGGTTDNPQVRVTQTEAPGALGNVLGKLLQRK
jgi:autotransporter translocation and assembly factor TamB